MRSSVAFLLTLVLVLATEPSMAGGGPEQRLRALWAAATDYLGAPAGDDVALEPWTREMVGRFVDSRFLAGRLLGESDPAAPAGTAARLAGALDEWMARQLANWLRRHRETVRRRLSGEATELVIQSARMEGELATAVVRVGVDGEYWDGRLKLHRRDGVWRVYDAEVSGLALQGVMRALWRETRRGHATPRAAIDALAGEQAPRAD